MYKRSIVKRVEMKSAGMGMTFSYDDAGNRFSVWYNGNQYLYQTNRQVDVVGIQNIVLKEYLI